MVCKKVGLAGSSATISVPFCATPLRSIFSILLECFFGTPMAQKESVKLFFSKSEFQKSKNVYLYYFYQFLEFYYD